MNVPVVDDVELAVFESRRDFPAGWSPIRSTAVEVGANIVNALWNRGFSSGTIVSRRVRRMAIALVGVVVVVLVAFCPHNRVVEIFAGGGVFRLLLENFMF